MFFNSSSCLNFLIYKVYLALCLLTWNKLIFLLLWSWRYSYVLILYIKLWNKIILAFWIKLRIPLVFFLNSCWSKVYLIGIKFLHRLHIVIIWLVVINLEIAYILRWLIFFFLSIDFIFLAHWHGWLAISWLLFAFIILWAFLGSYYFIM